MIMNVQTHAQTLPTTSDAAAPASLLRPALSLFLALSIITGLLYPLLVTVLGQSLFPAQAEGSLVRRDDTVIGSALIGQAFTRPGYFWSRPSATSPTPYNAVASGGSNLGPLNSSLVDAVKTRIEALRAANPGNTAPVPTELVTASGSGLDPHISVDAAQYQVARVAAARQLPVPVVQALVVQHIEQRSLGLFGEARINVLALNLALDAAGTH